MISESVASYSPRAIAACKRHFTVYDARSYVHTVNIYFALSLSRCASVSHTHQIKRKFIKMLDTPLDSILSFMRTEGRTLDDNEKVNASGAHFDHNVGTRFIKSNQFM